MRARQGSRIGEYILVEPIGEGGFGEVWKAHHNFFKDKVAAIKIPRDETYIKTLKTEGIIEHQLDNPHIVRILGFDAGHDPPYMVMEYVEGKSLRQLLKEKGKLPVDDAVTIFDQLLDVLEYAHGQGVVHRDIKPENILIEPSGTVKLTDFGLGLVSEKVKGSLLYSGSLTSTGKDIAGTAEYMSPEQRTGKGVDNRTDIYSLGIVLFEMLTGQLPAGRDLPSGLNPAVPKYLDYIYSKCCIRLAKRYRVVAEIQQHLREKEQLQRAIADSSLVHGTVQTQSKPSRLAKHTSDTLFWLNPVTVDDKERSASAEEVIETLVVKRKRFAWAEKTPCRKELKPGDMICFYAAKKGVVAHAKVKTKPKEKKCGELHHPEKFRWVFELDEVEQYLDKPVVIDAELRAALDQFRGRPYSRWWGWLVQRVRKISEYDFNLLTRQYGSSGSSGDTILNSGVLGTQYLIPGPSPYPPIHFPPR